MILVYAQTNFERAHQPVEGDRLMTERGEVVRPWIRSNVYSMPVMASINLFL